MQFVCKMCIVLVRPSVPFHDRTRRGHLVEFSFTSLFNVVYYEYITNQKLFDRFWRKFQIVLRVIRRVWKVVVWITFENIPSTIISNPPQGYIVRLGRISSQSEVHWHRFTPQLRHTTTEVHLYSIVTIVISLLIFYWHNMHISCINISYKPNMQNMLTRY